MDGLGISNIDLAIVLFYVLLMLGVGYYVHRRAPSFEEYLVAGRGMTTPILICTLASTYYGLDVLFGTSEIAYNDGVVAFFGYSGLSLGIYVFAAFALSKRLRTAKFTSLPEILERHYGKSAGVMGAVSSILYSVPGLSLFALGRICEVMFGVRAEIGALVMGSVALLYTLWGGLWAVAVTDTIQFVIMCVTLSIALPLLMIETGGFEAVAATLPETHFVLFGGIPIWLMLAYAATGISILVDPGFYQRVFAAGNFRQARNAMLISVAIWLAYDWLVTAGGMLAGVSVANGGLPADVHSNDVLLMAVTKALPIGLIGIFLAGVLATSMSTIDSYSLVAGANFSYDLYRPLRKPDISDRELVRMTKIGVIIAWLLGYTMAYVFERLMSLWVFNASLLTSTVLVPIFAGLYSKGRLKPLAGNLSLLFGAGSVISFYLGIFLLGEYDETWGTYIWRFDVAGEQYAIWQEYALFFTLPVSLIGFLLGARLGRPPAPAEASAP